jgi:hypothetical protein
MTVDWLTVFEVLDERSDGFLLYDPADVALLRSATQRPNDEQ